MDGMDEADQQEEDEEEEQEDQRPGTHRYNNSAERMARSE